MCATEKCEHKDYRNMKILLTTMSYPDKRGHIGGVFIHNQAVALKKRGYQVAVLYVDMRSIRRKRKWGYDTYSLDGIPVYRYSFPCGPFDTFIYKWGPNLAKRCYAKVRKEFGDPDLLHGHFLQGGMLANVIAESEKIPYVVTEHGSNVLLNLLNTKEQRLANRVYSEAKACIAVSNALRIQMQSITEHDIKVVPNILPGYMCYKPSLQQNSVKKDRFIYFSCGNLVKGKRFDLLLQAFAMLPDKNRQNSCIQIVGGGPRRKSLEKLAEVLGITKNLYFLGEVDNKQIPVLYQMADCFVLPSAFETFGVVYIEAMACGLPVIATRCGGPEEFVDDSNGVLIPANDVHALSRAMQKMFTQAKAYDKIKLSERVQQKFGENAICDRLAEIYSDVTSSKER